MLSKSLFIQNPAPIITTVFTAIRITMNTITAIRTATTMTNNASLLHLLHLVSPALPVGAYAYSQGLEMAVEKAWVCDRASAKDWIGNVMQHSMGRLDVPVLLRLYRAWQCGELQQVLYWNQLLQAARESKELLLEDVQMGQALWRLLTELGVANAETIFSAFATKNGDQKIEVKNAQVSFATAFSLAAQHWQVEEQDAARGFLWSWLENQVAGAIKLVPLGQTEAQHLLMELMPLVDSTVSTAIEIEDDDIGSGLPRLAMASMQHEVQYSRLFRS